MHDRPLWRPYTQELNAPPPLILERAEGAHLVTRDGRRIFDAISSWWLVTHGHAHPAIAEAIGQQSARLQQATFADFSHAPAEELAERLLRLTGPAFTRVFLTDNGSTAVEAALKMALQSCRQRGLKEKRRFLAFASGYHGDTVGAMSVSGVSRYSKPYRDMLFEVSHAEHPTHSESSVESFVRDFAARLEREHETLAGVIVEPLLQGAGGMVVWPAEAVRAIARLCREFGVLLIFDEVMTGFGRTGASFAMHKADVVPDLLCLSKGLTGGSLPLAATLVKEEIYAAFLSPDTERMLFHGHSFTGNAVSCAAAVANLRLFEDPKLPLRWREIERAQLDSLASLRTRLELHDTRVCGTVGAIEFVHDPPADLAMRARERGVFIRPLGRVVYVMPPYCAAATDIQDAWDVIATASI